jgi:hypothetical protein
MDESTPHGTVKRFLNFVLRGTTGSTECQHLKNASGGAKKLLRDIDLQAAMMPMRQPSMLSVTFYFSLRKAKPKPPSFSSAPKWILEMKIKRRGF